MNIETEKSVLAVDEELPIGLIANTAAILGMTIGKRIPELLGNDVMDADENNHLGIIEIPLPLLKAPADKVRELRNKLYAPAFEDLMAVDFSDLAQSCKEYGHYISKTLATPSAELSYWVCCHSREQEEGKQKLTGNFPLLD